MLVSTIGGGVKDRGHRAEGQARGRIAALESTCAFLQAENRQLWALAEEGAAARLVLEGVILDRDRLAAQCARLEPEHRGLADENTRLIAENAALRAEVCHLKGTVESRQRPARRPQRPFSKHPPTPPPRRPTQSLVAPGAAACHVGPRARAHAVVLSKECGLSATKIARLFGLFGLTVTAGGIVAVLHRVARAAGPTYAALVEGVRNSAVVSPDETGWRVGGRSAWLWAFVGHGVCVYMIAAGRGFAQATVVLGP